MAGELSAVAVFDIETITGVVMKEKFFESVRIFSIQ